MALNSLGVIRTQDGKTRKIGGSNGILSNAFDPSKFGGLFGDSGSKSGGDIPDAPTFWNDPNVAWSQDRLKAQSDYLLNGLTTDGGTLSGLMGDTVSFNPMVTQYALEAMQAQLAPSYRNSQQNLMNTLEANNQLTGSTTASAFGNLESDYMAQLTSATAQAGLADINRALQNRVSLYGTGLNTTQAVGNAALTNQAQVNNFALGNYENQVAQALGNAAPQTGGTQGALTGAAGGAMAGASFGPYGMIIGGALGAFAGSQGSPGTGGSILGAGASMYGSQRPGLQTLGMNQGIASQGGEQIYSGLRQPSIYQGGGYTNGLAGPISNYYHY